MDHDNFLEFLRTIAQRIDDGKEKEYVDVTALAESDANEWRDISVARKVCMEKLSDLFDEKELIETRIKLFYLKLRRNPGYNVRNVDDIRISDTFVVQKAK